MRRFFRNIKGAVTVLVSLLMIPAILITGTAVDLARIHTARSSVQNANQLAANAALTQYNALLNDIYGLFGIIKDYPTLGNMLIEYINVSLFGGEDQDRGLGTLQPFFGSNLQAPNVSFAPNQNLGNPEVLRQQIYEYTALRAPYILLEDIKILDIINSFRNLLSDALAIDTKLLIDEELEELDKMYQKIYDQINVVNSYINDVNNLTPQVNPILDSIKGQIDLLHVTRAGWTNHQGADHADFRNDLSRKYDGILDNIRALTIGGNIVSGWVEGRWECHGRFNDEGIWVPDNRWIPGYWSSSNSNPLGLYIVVSELRVALNNLDNALTDLINLSIDADVKRQEIESKVDNLEYQLGYASEALKKGMTEPEQYSVMCNLRALVQLDGMTLEEMANAVAGTNGALITQALAALDNMGFGNVSGLAISEPMVSLSELEHLRINNTFPINFLVTNPGGNVPDRLGNIAAVANYRFNLNLNLLYYQKVGGPGSQNMEFYTELHRMYGYPGTVLESARREVRNSFFQMARTVRNTFDEITRIAPGGEPGFTGEPPYTADNEMPFSENWNNESAARGSARNALNPSGGIMSMIGGMIEGHSERLLLLTYGTRMFSNFTTCSDGNDKTMSRVSMNTDVNFFFQSEQEYLFHGNLNSALANIAVVSGVILLIRFVMNYISTFAIETIRNMIKGMKTGGIKGVIVAEVVRVLWALGESVTDVISLLLGNDVHIFKWDWDQWNLGGGAGRFVIDTYTALLDRGVTGVSDLENIASSAIEEKLKIGSVPGGNMSIDLNKNEVKFEATMNYDQYIWLLLLTRSTDTLTRRIGHLISLNITHYKDGAADINFLHRAHTGFAITTAVDMRMLFLGLPMAQNFASEQGLTAPSTTLTVTARDYRGY